MVKWILDMQILTTYPSKEPNPTLIPNIMSKSYIWDPNIRPKAQNKTKDLI